MSRKAMITCCKTNLDLGEEVREDARARIERYKRRVVNAYNRGVKRREFQVRKLVLRRVGALGLAPNWEGPYKVIRIVKFGAHKLEDADGRKLSKPWNAYSLTKFHY
ncbi:UNVERIFIED_CONTAM: hypothetical protein Slati_2359300 [Sesamum latifolium]|uniref:Reverse transcriptase n=1 Tax=Sesamum latifolium TaxID=2727402 RepID=A0AAW2WAU3_9LAMI